MSKIKISEWAKLQGFTPQYAKQVIPRIKPAPVKDPVTGWWMVSGDAKIDGVNK